MSDKPQAYAPGVYGLVGGAVNVYILDDADSGVTIIDAGLPLAAGRVLGLIRDIGRKPEDVKHILITHADVDHVGSLKPLVDATGADVVASAESETFIRRRSNPPHIALPMSLLSRAVSLVFRRAVPVNRIVAGSDVLDIAGGIRVIATPGHTPDHVSYFWERERVLFSGDLLNNTDGLRLTPPRITWSMAAAHDSARKVLALNPAVICAGHGDVWLAEKEPERIEALLASLPDDGEAS
ncbi:MAG: MBL fold metallo-hydrolase [Anaerolineae bacterium]|nr:MBL fold metallo-hydrolase [Anaerolineae bacterium]